VSETKKLLGLGAFVTALLLIAAPAGALGLWTNTARNVESILTDTWNTSDGEPIVSATCRGLWSYPHVRTRLASWAGICTGNDESAGKRRSGKNARAPNGCART
jgi:hypothetical protein